MLRMLILFGLLFNFLTDAEASVGELFVHVQKSDIEEKLTTQIQELISDVYPDSSFSFSLFPKRIPSRLEENGIQIVEISQTSSGLPKGYTVFDVSYTRNGRKSIAKVQYQIKVQQQLYVPVRRIKAGEALSQSLFTKQWIDITKLRGKFLLDLSKVDGTVAAGYLRDGYPIRETDLDLPPIIHPGKVIDMYFTKNGIQFSIPVTSRVSASKGEEIKVWCEKTRKSYVVTVLSNSLVQWERTL